MRRYSTCAAANSRRPRESTGDDEDASLAPSAPPCGPGGWRIAFAAASAGSSSSIQRELALHLRAGRAWTRPLRVERPAGPSRGGRIEQGVKVSARVEGGLADMSLGGERLESRGEARRGPKRGSRLGDVLVALARARTTVCENGPHLSGRELDPRGSGLRDSARLPCAKGHPIARDVNWQNVAGPVRRVGAAAGCRTLTDGSSNCRVCERTRGACPGPGTRAFYSRGTDRRPPSGAERATSLQKIIQRERSARAAAAEETSSWWRPIARRSRRVRTRGTRARDHGPCLARDASSKARVPSAERRTRLGRHLRDRALRVPPLHEDNEPRRGRGGF